MSPKIIQDLGVLGALGLLFFVVAGVALVGPEAVSWSALASRAFEWHTAIGVIAGLVSLVLFLAAIVHKERPKDPNLVADQATLSQKILREFEREAFRNEHWESEDLRALFSACTETRIALSKDLHQVSSPIIVKLLRGVIQDLVEISKLSPFPQSETGIVPDRKGERCHDDRAHVAKWFMGAGEAQLGALFDVEFSPGRTREDKSGYIYGKLQQEVWRRLIPARATYLCLQRIRA